MSEKCTYASFTQHPKKIKLHVVCCVGGQGVPKEVLWHGVIETKKANLVRYVLLVFISNLILSGPNFISFVLSFKTDRNHQGSCVGRHRK